MSHLRLRKEKNCLNCNTEVVGRYCHDCGQENLEPKESIWHLLSHFFNDVTHFDGKFFVSLKDLILKPGFLSQQYMIGKRVTYLNPIRMYLFTSAIFFLIFFSMFKIPEPTTSINGKSVTEINKMDSATVSILSASLNNGTPLSKEELIKFLDKRKKSGIQFTGSNYTSRQQYDSVLKSGKKNHNWLERQIIYKQIELNTRYNNNGNEILKNLTARFVHTIPQMLFVLLPLFALILKLLYIRRKDFYYVDHVIFTLHLYVFIFISMLVIFMVNQLNHVMHWGFLGYVTGGLVIVILFYIYKALRNFYKQGRGKTILKYILLLFSLFLTTIFLFLFFFLFSLYEL
ncbi:MAG: DUF3667 domain-containing protein [Chitinophagaceae bacterium]|nr:DUF3667 domain-containing protein [Chitinophagaceae bacterium]